MKKKLELRILQIDLGRQKETVQYVKDYIDFAKENGYNAVLLYLEAAIKVACTPFFTEETSYTPEEIREIVAYGNAIGVDIIPGLENLAHVENFISQPGMQYLAECEDSEGNEKANAFNSCGCVSNEDAQKFFDTYYQQVIELFTSRYVHAGMDEPFDFAICPRCKARMASGVTKQDMFYEHIMRTYQVLQSAGKTMMMWDDFFEYLDIVDRLPRDIIMCNWNYGFITDEPAGHWTNRKKKDWFRLYDKLGFQYLFCPYGAPTSKLYNTDSFTNYAMKYHPTGVIMTMWERSNRFNLASYPALAYSGRLWNGEKVDKVKVFAEYLGSEEVADMVLNLAASGGSFQSNNLDICENMTLARHMSLNLNDYAVRKLKAAWEAMEEGLQKDILLDIYTLTLDTYLSLRCHEICLAAFDNYESRDKKPAFLTAQLEELKTLSNEAYELNKTLWAKYRPGILSSGNHFDKKYQGRAKRYDNLIAQLQKNEKRGVFYADLMLACYYGNPKIKMEICYKDKSVPVTTIKTTAKVADGLNTVRFAIENKPIDYVIFTATGNGAMFPMHFRYTCNGKKYVVSSVTKLQGEVKNIKRLLFNDTQFAEMGNNDGQVNFENYAKTKEEHKIKLKFKRFV